MRERIAALFARLDLSGMALGELRDLRGERLIPELPAKALCQLPRDIGTAGAVLAVNGDDFDHIRCDGPSSSRSCLNARPLRREIMPQAVCYGSVTSSR